MVMKYMSARTLQMEEMKLNLGPAKRKDLATAVGPDLVTLKELEEVELIKVDKQNIFVYDVLS